MSGNFNNIAVVILLNIVGVMLVMGAVILVLRGLGWVGQIPQYIIGALMLLATGLGILNGMRVVR
jgi:hypothetical protein